MRDWGSNHMQGLTRLYKLYAVPVRFRTAVGLLSDSKEALNALYFVLNSQLAASPSRHFTAGRKPSLRASCVFVQSSTAA